MGFFSKFTRQQDTPRKTRSGFTVGQQLRTSYSQQIKPKWYSGINLNPNMEIERQIDTLRPLAHWLVSYNGFASKYIELLATYVVGDNGFQIDPRITKADGALDTEVNDQIKAKFNEWASDVSVDGTKSFVQFQQQAIQKVGKDGECFVRLVYDDDLRLVFIDPALVDHKFYGHNPVNGNPIFQGIEFKGYKPVAYHIWNRYVTGLDRGTNSARERERIPAEEILHLFIDDAAVQVRGVTWLAPAIQTIARLDEYRDAHLLACQLAAKAPLSIERTRTNVAEQMQIAGQTVDAVDDGAAAAVASVIDLGDGLHILDLPEGITLKATALNFPTIALDATSKSYIKEIASAWNVSYGILASDNSDENYASGRLGTIDQQEYWKSVQSWFSAAFHKRVYDAWLKWNLLNGTLQLPTTNPKDYRRVTWLARGFRWVDPVKDTRSYGESVQNCFMNLGDVTAERGDDLREVLLQRKRELEMFAELGIPVPAVLGGGNANTSLADKVKDLEDTIAKQAATLKQQDQQLSGQNGDTNNE